MKRRAEYDLSSWENDERAQKLADSSIDYDTACDLIVLGLEWSVTDSELLTYFQQYGKITYAEVSISIARFHSLTSILVGEERCLR